MATPPAPFITPEALLVHWQGHRRLTRRVIDAFPDDTLFAFSVGGMRPFGALALAILNMAVPMVRGALSGDWTTSGPRSATEGRHPASVGREHRTARHALGAAAAGAIPETLTAFGQYPGVLHDLVLYVIDNEIHHRGQGYVYLRALGLEPPPFYDRG